MRSAGFIAFWLAAAAHAAAAQDLRVYSELVRLDPQNRIVRPDRGPGDPREILSPAVPRNGYSTFRVVVSGPPGTPYTLHAGMNPEGAVELALYREVYSQAGKDVVPDALEKIAAPYEGRLDSTAKAQSFLMDLHVARDAPVRRIKVEPQVWIMERWIAYPMEVRVVAATVPDGPAVSAPLPSAGLATDATVRAIFRRSLCGKRDSKQGSVLPPAAPLTGRSLLARNASQDVRGARHSAQAFEGDWCAPYKPSPEGPEWYLRVRDKIWRARE